MYSIGEKIIYGSLGVMEIVDISDQTVGDLTKKYYVLKEHDSSSSSLTYVPLDNESLTAQMKPLLTTDEILEVINRAKDEPDIEWIDDNRARSELYKKIISSFDRVKMLAMINSIYRAAKKREEEGKKNYISDENLMKRAEKLIYSEFSIVLGIPESEIPAFIENN